MILCLTPAELRTFNHDVADAVGAIATAFAAYEKVQDRAVRLGIPAGVLPPMPMVAAQFANLAAAVRLHAGPRPDSRSDELLNQEQTAALAGMSLRTLSRMIAAGQGPATVRRGRMCYVRRSVAEAWCAGLPTRAGSVPP